MSETTIERKTLIETLNALPEESLVELANFLEYLSYKTKKSQQTQPSQHNFSLDIAALGKSGQHNISESDEEILLTEVDFIKGWHHQ